MSSHLVTFLMASALFVGFTGAARAQTGTADLDAIEVLADLGDKPRAREGLDEWL